MREAGTDGGPVCLQLSPVQPYRGVGLLASRQQQCLQGYRPTGS